MATEEPVVALPTVNKAWVYSSRPEGAVSEDNYTLEELPVPELQEGQVLLETIYWSVDPYMRIQQAASNTWEEPHPLGVPQGGGAVLRVLASRDPAIPVKAIVYAYSGWQTHPTVVGSDCRVLDPEVAPVSTALGCLGMPGRTAFFGLYEKGNPKEGETVLVSGAAGAVGSIVVQLARVKGCRVVGIAGSDAKCALLKEYGCAATVMYKAHPTPEEMSTALKEACPDGIDVYYDNVGGMITDCVIKQINTFGRIVICGQISTYNGGLDAPELAPRFLHHVLYTRMSILGVLARDYVDRIPEMLEVMGPLVKDGTIKYQETVVEGFEKLPTALASMFSGANTGKLLVKASE